MEFLYSFMGWVEAHPGWAGLLVFLIAFSESLAMVGLFMPGAALMFGVGALVGSGAMGLGPAMGWAVLGAVAGDGLSYWLGRHYHQQLKAMWPFRKYPQLIARASDFFYHHGGKSILLGRFVGPIRPIIPAVAGMLEMSAWRFLAINVISATLWAPAYLIPGMLFGASLELAAEVASHLAMALLLLAVVLVALVWLSHRLFKLFHRHTHQWLQRTLCWSRLHPVAGKLPAALLDPEHPEARGLSLLALLLLAGAALFVLLASLAGEVTPLSRLDLYLTTLMQGLRTPGMDRLMVVVSELGGYEVLGTLFVVMLGWLLWQRRWQAAAHWAATTSFALLLTQTLSLTTTLSDATSTFPGSHTPHAMIVYGFLAVLAARELNDRHRWLAYLPVVILVGSIAFSRLYLGAQSFSGVLGGLTLGLAWAALLGIAYRRHPARTLRLGGLLGVSLASVAVAGTISVNLHLEQRLTEHRIERPLQEMAGENWWAEGWQELPAMRSDLLGSRRFPLTIQYAGALEPLSTALQANGWQAPPLLDGTGWLRWFSNSAEAATLPLPPQVHQGRNEALLLSRPSATEGVLEVLRLWPADYHLQPGNTPLWLGYVSELHFEERWNIVRLPRTHLSFELPLEQLRTTLEGVSGLELRSPQPQRLLLRQWGEGQ